MPSVVTFTLNGREVAVQAGTTIAAAILMHKPACRISVNGHLRGPVCGMGICFECRATINGRTQQRTCQSPCEPGMVVTTDER
ncbi:MAG TPA: (2Fe-2S)-binding protein [Terracidiphilus sp.]|jgi:sarcosine oxidase subunit alpha|nr:(2Fe-2S)-binding protein [Terracidiphilus sp.]